MNATKIETAKEHYFQDLRSWLTGTGPASYVAGVDPPDESRYPPENLGDLDNIDNLKEYNCHQRMREHVEKIH